MGLSKLLFGVVVVMAVFLWGVFTLGASYARLTQVTGDWQAVVVGALALIGLACMIALAWTTFIDGDGEDFWVFAWVVAMVAAPPAFTLLSSATIGSGLVRLGEFLFLSRFWSCAGVVVVGILASMGVFKYRPRLRRSVTA